MKHKIWPIIIAVLLCCVVGIFYEFQQNQKIHSPTKLTLPTTTSKTNLTLTEQDTESTTTPTEQIIFTEDASTTITSLDFSKNRVTIDPIAYLKDGGINKEKTDNYEFTIRENYLYISAYLVGQATINQGTTTKTLPVVFIRSDMYDMYGQTDMLATIYYDNKLHYFSLYQEQTKRLAEKIADGYNDFNLIKEKIWPDKSYQWNIEEVPLETNLKNKLPPMTLTLDSEQYELSTGFYRDGCYEGGRISFDFSNNFDFFQTDCQSLTDTKIKQNGFNVYYLKSKYPYKLLTVDSPEGLLAQAEILATGEKVLVFDIQKIVHNESYSSIYKGCNFSCNRYNEYRFIIGPGNLLYSYNIKTK